MSSVLQSNTPSAGQGRRKCLRLSADDSPDLEFASKHEEELRRFYLPQKPEPLLPVQDPATSQPRITSPAAGSDSYPKTTKEYINASLPFSPATSLTCGPQTRKILIRDHIFRNVLQRPQIYWSRESMMKALMVWDLNLACSHRPRDLVFVEEDSTFITYEDLWWKAEMETMEMMDADVGPFQKLASQHKDTGWVVCGVKGKVDCDVCGLRWRNGKVYKQMKEDERFIWERSVCYKCIGLTDADTGGVRRLVCKSKSPKRNALGWETGMKLDDCKEEHNPRPFDRLAQSGSMSVHGI